MKVFVLQSKENGVHITVNRRVNGNEVEQSLYIPPEVRAQFVEVMLNVTDTSDVRATIVPLPEVEQPKEFKKFK